jgi:hypothetical protein
MKKAVYITFAVLLLGWLAACGSEQRTIPTGKQFFDLRHYFEQEVDILQQRRPKVLKRVSLGTQTEEHQLDSINFKQELGVFANSDINRPAWSDKYAVDSIFAEGSQLAKLEYKALDEAMKTRKVLVEFKAGSVEKVFIENKSENTVASSSQLLTYLAGTGYTIESHQKVAMSDDAFFKVEVVFL